MPVPVISVAQMREWEEATWATGQTEAAVISLVGKRLATRALAITRPGDSILLLAGKGHNGDDARAMETHLSDRSVTLINVQDPVVAVGEIARELEKRPALVVDALFGIGLNRPLDHDWLHLIARINHAHARVLAVDAPSGLNADTGEVPTAAIRATETITIGAPKRGLLAAAATSYVGRLTVESDVGLAPCPCEHELQWTLDQDFAGFPPPRPVASHKGTFGHLAIVAGSRGFHGASVLAARGAQRSRPGLITLFTQENVFAPVAAQLQAVMVDDWRNNIDFDRFTGVLFGPGLAAVDLPSSLIESVRNAWSSFEEPVVVDASALSWLLEGSTPRNACRIITPHPGEAAALLGITSGEVQADRVAALRALARRFGNCWVVLKGHQTLIGSSTGEVFVNSSGSPALAQGGSGDLLSGYIAGWLSQPQFTVNPIQALRYAVWEHGSAADRLDARRGSWIVEELAEELGR